MPSIPRPSRRLFRTASAVAATLPLAFAGAAYAAGDHDHDHGHEYPWPTPEPGHPDIPLTVHEHDGEKEIETLIPMWFSVSNASSFADRGGFIATASPGFPGFGAGEHDHGHGHGSEHDHGHDDHGHDEHGHDEHGHEGHEHASFDPNVPISFRFNGTLSSWDGDNYVTESTAAAVQARNTSGPNDYWTQITGTGISQVNSDNTPGNEVFIGTTDSEGGLHAHVDWFLDGAPANPTAFLMEIEVLADGYETSEPLPVLFNYGMDEEAFEDAVYAAAEAYSIPEPGTAVLVGLGLTAVLVGRRRRRA